MTESTQSLTESMPRTWAAYLGIFTFPQTEKYFGLGFDYGLRVSGLCRVVTQEAVTVVARQTLVPSHATAVIAGPYTGEP